jgi:hypothetical protein
MIATFKPTEPEQLSTGSLSLAYRCSISGFFHSFSVIVGALIMFTLLIILDKRADIMIFSFFALII